MAPKKKAAKKTTAKAAVPLRPLADRVVIAPLPPETTTAFGIIIPESAQEKALEGVVVALGPGKYVDGALIPMSVSVGDTVMFEKYGYEEVKIAGKEYFIVPESKILAIINS